MKKYFSKINNLKSAIFFGVFVLFGLLMTSLSVNAYNFANDSGLTKTAGSAGYSGTPQAPEAIIASVIQMVLGLLGIAFLGFMIYSGILWMTAQGNDQKVQKAKDMITESIVGLIIVVAAYVIVYFVLNYFSSSVLVSN